MEQERVVTEGMIKAAKNASSSLGIPAHIIVTDEKQVVQYVNSSFETFTGFTQKEVVGRKCNFLQGEDTDPRDVMDMRLAIESMRETSVVILNYTKSHNAFWNTLRIRPIFNGGVLKGYVGQIFSVPVSSEWLRSRPRLCMDDALALMRLAATIPRTIVDSPMAANDDALDDLSLAECESTTSEEESVSVSLRPAAGERKAPVSAIDTAMENSAVFNETEEEKPDTSTAKPAPASSPSNVTLQRHVNYGLRFPTPPLSASPPLDAESLNAAQFFFVAETLLPTANGLFRVRAYRDPVSGAEPLALIVGDIEGTADVLCRVHDQCQTSEVFGSLKCDCKEQLDFALAKIQKETGVVLYLPQEGRGIGLANKVAAYAAQELGLDTVDANRHLGLPDDAREYTAVRDILNDLRIPSIRLLTNNPRKINELSALEIVVSERVPCITPPNSNFSLAYVKAKKERMFHMIDGEILQTSSIEVSSIETEVSSTFTTTMASSFEPTEAITSSTEEYTCN